MKKGQRKEKLKSDRKSETRVQYRKKFNIEKVRHKETAARKKCNTKRLLKQ